jgi:hypothetical protein
MMEYYLLNIKITQKKNKIMILIITSIKIFFHDACNFGRNGIAFLAHTTPSALH